MNVGLIQNQGLESQLNVALLRRSSIEWNARVNATWLANKALDLDGRVITTGLGSSVRDSYTGCNASVRGVMACDSTPKQMPVPGLYGAKLLNPTAHEAPIFATDQYIGPVYPTRIFGAGSTINLGQRLTLDAQGEYQAGAYVVNFIGYQNALRGIWHGCYDAQQILAGADGKPNTADDKTADVSSLDALTRVRCAIDRTQANSDYWASKTDFFKLRSVSLSWQVPERFIPRARGTSVTLAGRNLWKWTKYDGADPEANDASDAGTGLGRREYYQLPPFKSVILSVRTNF
jgi:hypothetical protein